MSLEDQHTDLKSLRAVTGKTADWDVLAKDLVAFANGEGGRLPIRFEVQRSRLKRALAELVLDAVVVIEGEHSGARYRLKEAL